MCGVWCHVELMSQAKQMHFQSIILFEWYQQHTQSKCNIEIDTRTIMHSNEQQAAHGAETFWLSICYFLEFVQTLLSKLYER